MSQTREAILTHLKAGGVITKIMAISPPFSTTNLGDAVLHLRRDGHKIEKRWRTSEQRKRPFAEYYMECDPQPSAASDGSTGVRLAGDS